MTAACSDSATHFCPDAVYPDEKSSPFVLPYPAEEAYTVGQGNCVEPGTGSHAQDLRGEFAYDILMPTGTTLLATRDGVVFFVEETFAEGDSVTGTRSSSGIEDGTMSNYGHLAFAGAFVEEGEVVTQGQPIGMSGNTGRSSEPHLHFEVLECSGEPLVREPVVSLNSPVTRCLPRSPIRGPIRSASSKVRNTEREACAGNAVVKTVRAYGFMPHRRVLGRENATAATPPC